MAIWGRAWYRTKVTVELPQVRNVFLWLPATDGSARVYVNGKHVTFKKVLTEGGGTSTEEMDRFIGYAAPANFDITGHLESGENTIAIECERVGWNEIGTGGLLGAPIIYHQSQSTFGTR